MNKQLRHILPSIGVWKIKKKKQIEIDETNEEQKWFEVDASVRLLIGLTQSCD